jgi:hypothetical protein
VVELPPIPEPAVVWRVRVYHRGVAAWYFFVSALLILGPDTWYGPTWSYFAHIPHGGGGLGLACFFLWLLMSYGIIRRSRRILTWALNMGGVAFWVAAAMLVAEGLAGGTGFMEAPFMLYVSVDLFLNASVLGWRR